MRIKSFESLFNELYWLNRLYQKNIIDEKRQVGSWMELQIKNQLELTSSDLYQNFLTTKKRHADQEVTTTAFVLYLKRYKGAIDEFVGLNHTKLGSAEVIDELKQLTALVNN